MTRRPPLRGVRVIDMTRYVAGSYCTMLLADHGADVVKVEPPGGEETRQLGPWLVDDDGEQTDVSTYFLRFNRSKRSVCLDLKLPGGLDAFRALVARADVLVENFRAGVLEGLGMDWSTLRSINPRLIYATITGYGYEDSPLRDRGAFTPIVEAMAGAVNYPTLDQPPLIAAYPVGDLFPASLTVAGIAMALLRREADGEGSRVDMAMYDAMVSMNERALGVSAMLGRDSWPGLRRDIGSAPSGIFCADDGYVAISVVGERMWQRFCDAIGQPGWATDEGLSTGPARAACMDEVIAPGIQEWLHGRTREEAVTILAAAGVPAAPVARPLEVIGADQTVARSMMLSYPAFGHSATVAADPIRFGGETPHEPGPAPTAGEHTARVLQEWAGMDQAAIDALLASGAASQAAVPGELALR